MSAILAADVAGYSRLMHHDEEATHAELTALLADSVEPAIAEHGRRVVKNSRVIGRPDERHWDVVGDHNHPELKGSFEGLQSGRGMCCDGNDALHLSR